MRLVKYLLLGAILGLIAIVMASFMLMTLSGGAYVLADAGMTITTTGWIYVLVMYACVTAVLGFVLDAVLGKSTKK